MFLSSSDFFNLIISPPPPHIHRGTHGPSHIHEGVLLTRIHVGEGDGHADRTTSLSGTRQVFKGESVDLEVRVSQTAGGRVTSLLPDRTVLEVVEGGIG